jgi:signal peptidase I
MALWVLAAAAATLSLAVCWLRRRFVAVTVTGRSMEPAYRHGDRVLVRRAALPAVRAGQVVVLAAPHGGWMIKRAAALPGDPVPALLGRGEPAVPAGALVVLGDNTALSGDSRRMGYFDGASLLGVVVGMLSRPTEGSGRATPPAG